MDRHVVVSAMELDAMEDHSTSPSLKRKHPSSGGTDSSFSPTEPRTKRRKQSMVLEAGSPSKSSVAAVSTDSSVIKSSFRETGLLPAAVLAKPQLEFKTYIRDDTVRGNFQIKDEHIGVMETFMKVGSEFISLVSRISLSISSLSP